MNQLVSLLTTPLFPAAEVERLIAEPRAEDRRLVLSAVRAESEDRFLEAAAAIFALVDWSSGPASEWPHHPLFTLLAWTPSDIRETACDHLAVADLAYLWRRARSADAGFALDVVKALELGDASAAERVRARLSPDAVGIVDVGTSGDTVSGVRFARIVRGLLGDTDADQLRSIAQSGQYRGSFATMVAGAIAEDRGLALPEDLAVLQDNRRLGGRLLIWVARAVDPALVEEVLATVVEQGWHLGDVETFDLPWDRAEESIDDGKFVVARRVGRTVLKATGAFETGGARPGLRKKARFSTKQHPTEAKANAEVDKLMKGGTRVSPGGRAIAGKDELLHRLVRDDDSREWTADLLREGASPNHVDRGGEATLHRATMSKDCGDLVRRLLAAGADATRLDGRGASALDRVATSGAEGSVIAAKRLVAAGARCHQPGVLFDVAERGYHAIVPALVAGGASLDATKEGLRPADVAMSRRRARTAAALRGG